MPTFPEASPFNQFEQHRNAPKLILGLAILSLVVECSGIAMKHLKERRLAGSAYALPLYTSTNDTYSGETIVAT